MEQYHVVILDGELVARVLVKSKDHESLRQALSSTTSLGPTMCCDEIVKVF
jgi:hypothetical protein